MRDAVIVAYGRSALAKARKGSFAQTHPVEYAAQTLNGVLLRIPQVKPENVDDVVVGCAMPYGVQGYNIGKLILQRAGFPESVPAQTVNRFCSSGLQSIATAANTIISGAQDILIAGGVETMSMVSMMPDPLFFDPWLTEHFPDAYISMGITAENIAEAYQISRDEMDQFAVQSHRKAHEANERGDFKNQIVPVKIKDEQGHNHEITQDEGIRSDTSEETLAALKPAFLENGSVTAGTSSQMTDGASFVVMMSSQKARELGIRPIARFVSFAVAGVPANMMGMGPVKAVPKALAQAGLTIEDIDVIELNEAFASQAIACIRELHLPLEKVNPWGGAIALGHPLGATGAVLTCKALSYLQKTKGRYGLVTMCIGGGMGAAGIFENLF